MGTTNNATTEIYYTVSISNQTSEIVSDQLEPAELSVEIALRPKKLSDFTGQSSVKDQLNLILDSAKGRSESPEHLLFAGPPGLGKTTLAMIVASELGVPIKITSGPTLTHAGDLAAVLSSLTPSEVLFIDEIHRVSKPVQEMLYVAMEDFRVDIIVGKGVGASSINLPLPHFTVIGATTRTGLLPNPLKDRFGWVGQMDFYNNADLTNIVLRSAKLLDANIDTPSAEKIAQCSRGTARIANRILKRVRDYAFIHNDGVIDLDATQNALELFQIDQFGLDKLDQKLLKVIIKDFAGGPVGVSNLAISLSEELDTIEDTIEPYLIRSGYINRTSNGRRITAKGLQWYENTTGETMANDLGLLI